ncbi:MAG: GHKL domain-containing protein [Synergistaceae bacterium]|nr:GHKL domain-containing protein [Synergistaceae bacterium]MBQ9903918.1 GHKL domain-containing protein [Synergistaceae bacterium]MBR0185675.1 GHKL domain-containing protein [Synergistaceae bacterium]
MMAENLTLRYILEFAIIIPAVIFAVLPVLNDLRFKSWLAYVSGGILLVLFVTFGAYLRAKFFFNSAFIMIPYSILFFIVYIMIIDASTGRKLFCFFNSVMLCAFCPLYTVFIMAPLEAENEIWHTAGLFTLQSSVVNTALVLLIGGIFFKTLCVKLPMLMRQKYIDSVWDFLFLVPLFMTVLMLWSIPIHPDLAMVGRLRPAALIFLWLILMMILLLYHVFWWTALKLTEGAKLQQENTLLMMEGKRYEELRGYMEETRALRHDFRQHILVITQLSVAGKFNELQNYLEQFSEGTETNYTGYCDNSAVDAVASHYTAFAESQSTKIEWNMTLPHDLPMKESDYCVVLGNLLENALRAVKKLSPECRNITVISSLLSETIIGLSVDNPYIGKIKFRKNGLPRPDREGHGIGLTSVRNTVSRYDGSMNITAEKNVFSVDIVFHCNAE